MKENNYQEKDEFLFNKPAVVDFNIKPVLVCNIAGELHIYDYCREFAIPYTLDDVVLGKGVIHSVDGIEQVVGGQKYYFFKRKE